MRQRGLLLLLVLLLPLRLWAGQLMPTLAPLSPLHATDHATHHVAGPAATAVHSASSGMEAPCHSHLQGQADPSDTAQHGANSHHLNCQHCQLCHGGALPGAAPATAHAVPACPLVAASEPSIIGIDLLPLDKPPIS